MNFNPQIHQQKSYNKSVNLRIRSILWTEIETKITNQLFQI